jgi:hypothetical protein
MRGRRGSVTLLVALASAAVFGLGAISVDAGRAYVSRQHLVNIVDAAAMAGVRELPGSPHDAVTRARESLVANGRDPALADITVLPPGNVLRVVVQQALAFPFGAVLGLSGGTIGATAEAESFVLGRVQGAQPFGVETQPFQFGQAYTIKLGGKDDDDDDSRPQRGNFRALALGGTGASTFRNNIKYGFSGFISAGQTVLSEPGNMKGPTRDGIEYRLEQAPHETFTQHSALSPRLIIVPIVASFQIAGRKELRVLGFGTFFLEDYDGGDIRGRFLAHVREGEAVPGAVNFGTTSYRLRRSGP